MRKKYYLLALFTVLINAMVAQNIVITEIMYNPPESGTDSTEFIELYNNGSGAEDLSGWFFSSGITFTFPSGVILNPGEYVVVATDSMAIYHTYGLTGAYSYFSGGLSNSGEPIALRTAGNVLVDTVRYDDGAPWPSGFSEGGPDGGGASIVLCDVNTDNNDGNNWISCDSSANTGINVNGREIIATPGNGGGCPVPCTNTMATDTQVACVSYTWINGLTYTSSNNTAMDTLVNAAGCDSIITLNLTINQSTSSIDSITACESYTWINGITYISSNNTAMDTLVNAAGCDSIITLNLTINQPTSSVDSVTACESYTWINGITYTSSNNTAMDTLMNAAGCDSIVTLNLSIIAVNSTVSESGDTIIANNTNASYQWLDCNGFVVLPGDTSAIFVASGNGSYAVLVTENGCSDTSICVNLTTVNVLEPYFSSDVNIYPNPTEGIVNIKFNGASNASIEIYNALGRLIHSNYNVSSSYQFELGEETGFYFVKINYEGKESFYKLSKK